MPLSELRNSIYLVVIKNARTLVSNFRLRRLTPFGAAAFYVQIKSFYTTQIHGEFLGHNKHSFLRYPIFPNKDLFHYQESPRSENCLKPRSEISTKLKKKISDFPENPNNIELQDVPKIQLKTNFLI